MSSIKEMAKMYDALLSIKSLNDSVKLDIRIPSRMTLLLAIAVEQGLAAPEPTNLLNKILTEEDQVKLQEISLEILRKGQLEDFYRKLKEMSV